CTRRSSPPSSACLRVRLSVLPSSALLSAFPIALFFWFFWHRERERERERGGGSKKGYSLRPPRSLPDLVSARRVARGALDAGRAAGARPEQAPAGPQGDQGARVVQTHSVRQADRQGAAAALRPPGEEQGGQQHGRAGVPRAEGRDEPRHEQHAAV